MKKLLLLSCLCATFLFMGTTEMNAQRRGGGGDSSGPTMAIKTNPITLAFNWYNASFEKSMGKTSFLIGANYVTLGDDVLEATLFGMDLGYRYYITNGNMEGFYVNPKVGFLIGSDDNDASATLFTLAAELGYQVRTDGGFVFDIGIGPAWRKAGGDSGTNSGGRWPSATLAIGYAF